MDTALWAILLSSILAGFGWLFKSEKEKRHEVEKQLSDEKYKVYQDIIQLFIDLVNVVRLGSPVPQEDITNKMMIIMKDLIIYGSDPVLKKFSLYKQTAKAEEPIKALKLYYDVMIEIRKDMGHPKTIANEDDLLGMFIYDYNNYRDEIIQMR